MSKDKLEEDINKVVAANDWRRLKTLLQHESLNMGMIDNMTAWSIMSNLRGGMTYNYNWNRRNKDTFTLSEMMQFLEGKTICLYIIN